MRFVFISSGSIDVYSDWGRTNSKSSVHPCAVPVDRAQRQCVSIPCHMCSDAQHLSVDNLSFVAGLRCGPISAPDKAANARLRARLSKPESLVEDDDAKEVFFSYTLTFAALDLLCARVAVHIVGETIGAQCFPIAFEVHGITVSFLSSSKPSTYC